MGLEVGGLEVAGFERRLGGCSKMLSASLGDKVRSGRRWESEYVNDIYILKKFF